MTSNYKKYFAYNVDISATTSDIATTRVTIADNCAERYSPSLLSYVLTQSENNHCISQFGHAKLLGSEGAIPELQARARMPRKIIRLHHTDSNILPTDRETVWNLLQIGLFRSCISKTAKRRLSSPIHLVNDGVFHLGYDAIIIPHERYMRIVVNPTINYNEHLDIAIVGVYREISTLTDWLHEFLNRFLIKYFPDSQVRDHHPDDPFDFGVGTTSPIAVSSLSGAAFTRIRDKILEFTDMSPLGWLIHTWSDYDNKMSSQEVPTRTFVEDIKKQEVLGQQQFQGGSFVSMLPVSDIINLMREQAEIFNNNSI